MGQTKNGRINYATEIAFAALRESASKQGLAPQLVMGLMYLPDQAATRAFQVGCREALASMGVVYEEDALDEDTPGVIVEGGGGDPK